MILEKTNNHHDHHPRLLCRIFLCVKWMVERNQVHEWHQLLFLLLLLLLLLFSVVPLRCDLENGKFKRGKTD